MISNKNNINIDGKEPYINLERILIRQKPNRHKHKIKIKIKNVILFINISIVCFLV